MTREHGVDPAIRSWLDHTSRSPVPTEQTVAAVMSVLPRTPQRRGRWTSWRRRGSASRPDGPAAPEAAVVKRVTPVAGVAGAYVVAVLALVIGGVALVAGPLDPWSVAGPGSDSSVLQAPVEFSGQLACGMNLGPAHEGFERRLAVGDAGMQLTRFRDGAWRQTAEMSDQRLEGIWYNTSEADAYQMPDSRSGPAVSVSTWRIENDEGAWQGGQTGVVFSDGTAAETLAVLEGEDAFAGLTAVMSVTAWESGCGADLHGLILDRAPLGEPYRPDAPAP